MVISSLFTGQMQKEHIEKLRRNWVRLSEETPFTLVVLYLYQEKVFNKITVEDILHERPSHRSWIFLDSLQRSGPRGFETFLQALKNFGKADVAELLEIKRSSDTANTTKLAL